MRRVLGPILALLLVPLVACSGQVMQGQDKGVETVTPEGAASVVDLLALLPSNADALIYANMDALDDANMITLTYQVQNIIRLDQLELWGISDHDIIEVLISDGLNEDRLVLLRGEFFLDDIEDSLEDADFRDREYGENVVWRNRDLDISLLLVSDEVVVIGGDERIQEVLDVKTGVEPSISESAQLMEAVDGLAGSITYSLSDDCEFRSCRYSARGLRVRGGDLSGVELYTFRDEERAERGLDDLEDDFQEFDLEDVDIVLASSLVRVTGFDDYLNEGHLDNIGLDNKGLLNFSSVRRLRDEPAAPARPAAPPPPIARAVPAPTAPPAAPAAPRPAAPAPAAPAAPAAPRPATAIPAAPAPAAPAPAAPARAQPPQSVGISIIMAVPEVTEPFGDFEAQTYGAAPSETNMGFFDALLVHDGTNPMAPFAAESWEINTRGDELTLAIRSGLKVNTPQEFAGNDFGFIAAEDVAWNMNRQNAVINRNLGPAVGAQLGATFAECYALGSSTVKCPLITNIFWGIPITEFDINDTSVRLDSKTAYDTMGAAALRYVPVGSGPMVFSEVRANDRLEVVAMPGDHWATIQGVWSETPKIGSFTVIQVPDTQSRVAMMQTGQADLGEVDFGRIRELPGLGLRFFPTMSEADTMTLSVIWPGNLWTDTNAKTGESIQPWLSSVYDEDLPHLGNPWCDLGKPCRYNDTNNPPGMSDMEQARLVRWALSMTIDREGIVEELQGGMGTPIYLEVMGPKFPGWRPDRTVKQAMINSAHEKYSDSAILGAGTSWPEYDIATAEPDYEWPWEIPTDFAEAERLLDLAGFPRGSNGVRFEITMNKYRCETGPVCLEQADAVAAGWEQVGVRTTLLTEEYGSVVVPRMRDRTQPWPVVKNCSVETANYPFDWPPPPSDSTFSRPAWGCSFESKYLDYMFINVSGERDSSRREAMHLDMVDYYYYWQLYSGISQPPRGVAGNPETVASWNSRSTAGGFWGRPQHIVPRN